MRVPSPVGKAHSVVWRGPPDEHSYARATKEDPRRWSLVDALGRPTHWLAAHLPPSPPAAWIDHLGGWSLRSPHLGWSEPAAARLPALDVVRPPRLADYCAAASPHCGSDRSPCCCWPPNRAVDLHCCSHESRCAACRGLCWRAARATLNRDSDCDSRRPLNSCPDSRRPLDSGPDSRWQLDSRSRCVAACRSCRRFDSPRRVHFGRLNSCGDDSVRVPRSPRQHLEIGFAAHDDPAVDAGHPYGPD